MGELPPVNEGRLSSLSAALLQQEWAIVLAGRSIVSTAIPQSIRDAIVRSIDSRIKTYRYVLPTQLLAKAADANLDCRSIQATAPLAGAFDARSICQSVIVPFDRATECVLGGSSEPYANNPVRIPAFLPNERSAQKDRAGFDNLCLVLEYSQNNAELARDLLRLVLSAILARLGNVRVVYPTPNRVSQESALECVSQFLSERTGGIRLQAVSVGLFRTIGEIYQLFTDVRSNNINSADASTGSTADLECVVPESVVKAIEVKDRKLTLLHVQDKLPGLREKGIREAVFIVQGGIAAGEREQVEALIRKEFGSGQNVYVAEFMEFLTNHLILFGEAGRRTFLKSVCTELDERHADVSHRQRWRDLLAAI